jgi:RND superfamily putative drug exporter
VTNVITMIGLAVGIDYSLFVVSRYREERGHGLDKLSAIARAGGTASRTVFFSGITVIIALLGMLIVPQTIFRSIATEVRRWSSSWL